MALGEQIRKHRAGRFTQVELAVAAGVAINTVRDIEQGVRAMPTLSTLHKLATALDVDVSDLVERPVRREAVDPDAGVLALRRAVLQRTITADHQPVEKLQRALTAMWTAYRTDDLSIINKALPGILDTCRATMEISSTDAVNAALSEGLCLASSTLVLLGYADLAALPMHQAVDAAKDSGDELRYASGQGWLSWLMLHQTGLAGEARALAERAAHNIEPDLSKAPPVQLSVWGSLITAAGVASARDGKPDTADDFLKVAWEAAERIDEGNSVRIDYEVAFGRPYVTMQLVDSAVTTGRSPLALKRAKDMSPDAPLALMSRGRHMCDVAFALTDLHKDEKATNVLGQIDRLAPNFLQQAFPRQILTELRERERRVRTPRLRELCVKAGLAG